MVRDSSSSTPHERVNLGTRDWLGISGSLVGVLAVVLASYNRMDRSLVGLEAVVRSQGAQIEALQDDVTRLESRLFGGVRP